MADIKHDTAHTSSTSTSTDSKQPNGNTAVVNGKGKGKGEQGASLALPKTVVEEGVRVIREVLDMVVYVDE